MKKKITILTLLTLIALVSACSHKNTDMTNQTQSNNQVVDTTTGPSWVTDDQSLDTAVKDKTEDTQEYYNKNLYIIIILI